MSDENQNEGNPQTPGGTEAPPSTPSSQESQPLPGYVTELQSQIAQLQADLRGRQKSEDTFYGKVGTDIKRILELNEKGLDAGGIERELFLDQLMKNQTQPQNQSTPVQPSAGNGQPNNTPDVESELKSLQFPENDVGLASLRKLYGKDPQKLILEAAKLRLSQVSSPNPSGATSLSPQGQVNQEPLQQQYENQRNEIVKTYRGDEVTRRLAELRVTFRQKGLATV